jgi:hypothetical protein
VATLEKMGTFGPTLVIRNSKERHRVEEKATGFFLDGVQLYWPRPRWGNTTYVFNINDDMFVLISRCGFSSPTDFKLLANNKVILEWHK